MFPIVAHNLQKLSMSLNICYAFFFTEIQALVKFYFERPRKIMVFLLYLTRIFLHILLVLELTNEKNAKNIKFIFISNTIMQIKRAVRTQITFDKALTVSATRQCVVVHYHHFWWVATGNKVRLV